VKVSLDARRQDLRTGQTLGMRDGIRLLVWRPPRGNGVVACDGIPLANMRPGPCSEQTPGAGGATIWPGQWMIDPVSGLEVLCTRAGPGALTFDGRELMPRSREASAAPIVSPSPRNRQDGLPTRPSSRLRQEAARLRALEEGQLVRVRMGGPRVPALCVTKLDGCYLAVVDACSHGRARLSEGTLAGSVVTCPLHAASFDMRTGSAVAGGWASVACYDVAVSGNGVTGRRQRSRAREYLRGIFRVLARRRLQSS
jgi:nitrite reductase/ring-hydroxylating ferredoxin subunit